MPANVVSSMTHTFKTADAKQRARLQQDLEEYRTQQAQQNFVAERAEIEEEQAQRGQNYDAETLRYKAALEKAGYLEVEVDGLVEIFAPSPEAVRQVYWQAISSRQDSGI